MTLKSWLENHWLRPHTTSAREIGDLLRIVERDLRDARSKDLSADWQFGIAYNAALKLCTILLHAEGYRPEKTLQHYRAIQALPLILGQARSGDADYLDTCRVKRNIAEYDRSGAIAAGEAAELIHFVEGFHAEVSAWLQARHPELLRTPGSRT